MATKTVIKIGPEVKDRLNKLAGTEGKTPRQALRGLIENYTEEIDTCAYIDDLWTRIGGRIRSKGLGQRGINGAIREVRSSRGCHPKSERR